MSFIKDIDKVTFAPLVKKLELKNYNPDDPALEDWVFWVWVNFSKEMHDRWNEIQTDIYSAVLRQKNLQKEYMAAISENEKGKDSRQAKGIARRIDQHDKELKRINDEMMAWYSEVWSKHKDVDTHVTPEEVSRFAHHLMEIDKGLWAWITDQTQALIISHVNKLSKN